MPTYTDQLKEEVRLEYMRPEAIDAAREKLSAIYVPFGAMEWHGYHNPTGLDGLKAHEHLVGLAARVGSVVYPPIYFGAGGGHKEYPNTYMVDADAMIRITTDLLHRFEANGYEKAILLSGHYPNPGDYVEPAVEAFNATNPSMQILQLVEANVPGVGGDHAAKHETSYMLHLYPHTVDMQRLDVEPRDDIGEPDVRHNWMDDDLKAHPCYGIVGIDPRTHASAETGKAHTELLLDHLADWVTK
jgi:creatinine amidohydrolase